jgi:AcrR family transcriptional regulator
MALFKPRGIPQQERSQFTVKAILQAAERLFAERGRATTRAIADLAGVSVGTLYQYFPAKEAVVAAIIDRRIADDEALLNSLFGETRELPLRDAIHRAIDTFVPHKDWERQLYPRMVDVLESLERLEPVHQMLGRFEVLWADELLRRRAELAPGLDPKCAATVTLHAMRAALLALSRSQPALPRAQLVSELERLTVRYLCPE